MKYDKAIDILEQALLLVREISDRESEGLFLGDLGVAYNKSGNEEKGQELLRTSIYILRAIDSPDVNSFRMELQQLPPRAFVRELVGEIINMPVGCLIWIIIVEAIIGLYLLLNWLNKI